MTPVFWVLVGIVVLLVLAFRVFYNDGNRDMSVLCAFALMIALAFLVLSATGALDDNPCPAPKPQVGGK